MTLEEAYNEAMKQTLGDIALSTGVYMKALGYPIKGYFITLLSEKFMEVAKEAGATPGDCILAMVNYLTSTVCRGIMNEEKDHKSGQ